MRASGVALVSLGLAVSLTTAEAQTPHYINPQPAQLGAPAPATKELPPREQSRERRVNESATLTTRPIATPRQIAEKTLPAVVLLTMQDETGRPVAYASGFFVREDLIATNFHAVATAFRVSAKLIGKATTYEITGAVSFDEDIDLAVLKTTRGNAGFLGLGDDSRLAVGDKIYAAGNPRGLEGTFSEGIVSAIRYIGSQPMIQITAPISPGSSGGPVLDSRGEVIGVAVATVRDGQNLNFAVPVASLRAMLSRGKDLSSFPLSPRAESRRGREDPPPTPPRAPGPPVASLPPSGWYLAAPPIYQPKQSKAEIQIWWLLPDAPIRRWERIQAFDSAASCEDERAKFLDDAKKLRDVVENKIFLVMERSNPLRFVASERIHLAPAQGTMARCISSADPALR